MIYYDSSTTPVSTTARFVSYEPTGNVSAINVQDAITELDSEKQNIIYTPAGTGAVSRTVESKLGESVSVKDFGAVGDGVTDDTVAIQAAAAVTGCLDMGSGTYLINPTSSITFLCSSIQGDNATIKLGGNVNDTAIEFSNAYSIMGIVFDGNGFYCTDTDYRNYIVFVSSEKVSVSNCEFKNAVGLENRFQYGLGIDWNTRSVVVNCLFDNIHTVTNTANNGGFCGGVLITTDFDNPTTVSTTNHTVENCEFSNIWTTANALGDTYADSDAIRSVVHDYTSLSSTLQNLVRSSTISVKGCSFTDVRKSATKLNHCIVTVEQCRFSILDAGVQTLIAAAFRYQTGPFFSVRDCSVSGLFIGSGVLAAGSKNVIDNLYFTSTYVGAQGVFIGNVDNVESLDMSRVYIDSGSKLARLKLATNITMRDCVMAVDTAEFIDIVENVETCNIINCKLKGKAVLYAGAKTITNFNVTNSTIDNSFTGSVFGNITTTNLLLDGVQFTSTNGSVVQGGLVTEATIKNSHFTTSGTVSSRVFDFTTTSKVVWENSHLVDTSNKDAGIFVPTAELRINGGTFNVVCTNAQILVTTGANPATVKNLDFIGGYTCFIEMQKRDKVSVHNIHSEVSNGVLEFWSNIAGYTAAVVGFTGQLAATPVITTNYTVTQTGTSPL